MLSGGKEKGNKIYLLFLTVLWVEVVCQCSPGRCLKTTAKVQTVIQLQLRGLAAAITTPARRNEGEQLMGNAQPARWNGSVLTWETE